MIETTDGYTICSCNHLTHFAVLFDARGTSSRVNGSEKSVQPSTCCDTVFSWKVATGQLYKSSLTWV